MKAVSVTAAEGGSKPAVSLETNRPEPVPGPRELLIRVHAAGLTPTELDWYPTTHTRTGAERTGAIPGHEFSGVIAGAGAAISAEFVVGASVYGMNGWYQDGALAEYCLTEPCFVAAKPPGLSDAEAASIPISALTAWQGLFDRALLQPGERVLIHGGAGAVGAYAVQLARYRGAQVFATASAHNLEFVKSLGAEVVIDYAAQPFEDVLKDVDVVFDTVGGETLERSWRTLSARGRVVTIAAAGESATDERVKNAFLLVKPDNLQLSEVAELFAGGHLRTCVDLVVPLQQAPEAFNGGLKARRSGRGKIVVSLAGE